MVEINCGIAEHLQTFNYRFGALNTWDFTCTKSQKKQKEKKEDEISKSISELVARSSPKDNSIVG